jgi:hypothetical protein
VKAVVHLFEKSPLLFTILVAEVKGNSMNNIKPLTFVVTLMFLVAAIEARNDDQFNFGETIANPSGNGFDFGPAEWDKVTCDDLGSCVSSTRCLNGLSTPRSLFSHRPLCPIL